MEVYARAYHPRRPVVCMDETHKQLIGEVREPLTGRSHVEAGERRTRQDWARWIEGMLERRYPEAERVVLVMDNLNPHGIERCTRPTSPDTLANWRNDSKSITRRSTGAGSTLRKSN